MSKTNEDDSIGRTKPRALLGFDKCHVSQQEAKQGSRTYDTRATRHYELIRRLV